MRVDVRTVIIPMAGVEDRFLPATRAIPHALLPVLDTPLIQFALDEARAAGAERIVLVARPDDVALHDYVAGDALALRENERGRVGAAARVEALRRGTDIAFVPQPEPLGVGHAVLQASAHALPGPVAVILPDDLFLGAPALPELVERYQRSGAGHMATVAEVAREAVSGYGVLDPLGGVKGGVVRAVGVAEKPAPEDAPSRLALAGRYVLHPRIFIDLAALRVPRGGRIELTHAIARGIDRLGLQGSLASGRWYDCASPDGLLDAAIALRRHRRRAAHAVGAGETVDRAAVSAQQAAQ